MMLPKQGFSPAAPPSPSEAGFSIVEGLIAALLLLVVTLGILPLFSRAMNNNVKGNDSTRQSNGAIDAFETSIQLPLNSGDMTVAATTNQTLVVETIALKAITAPTGGADHTISGRWELLSSLDTTVDTPVMNRQRILQQFSFNDFTDSDPTNNPLDGAVESRLVHLKVVDITIQESTDFATTAFRAQPYQLRLIRAF